MLCDFTFLFFNISTMVLILAEYNLDYLI
jgi:hypothetical protein